VTVEEQDTLINETGHTYEEPVTKEHFLQSEKMKRDEQGEVNMQNEEQTIRPINITTNYIMHPEGSVLIELGKTKVICNATIEDRVPPFLRGQGKGWITAEYSDRKSTRLNSSHVSISYA